MQWKGMREQKKRKKLLIHFKIGVEGAFFGRTKILFLKDRVREKNGERKKEKFHKFFVFLVWVKLRVSEAENLTVELNEDEMKELEERKEICNDLLKYFFCMKIEFQERSFTQSTISSILSHFFCLLHLSFFLCSWFFVLQFCQLIGINFLTFFHSMQLFVVIKPFLPMSLLPNFSLLPKNLLPSKWSH